MIVGVGVDIVEVKRIRRALEGTERMITRVFTPQEVEYCQSKKNRYQHFAGRFAAKEAALKALGTGWQEGIRWTDVEVDVGHLGQPFLRLHQRAEHFYQKLEATNVLVTITHADDYAVSVVILEK